MDGDEDKIAHHTTNSSRMPSSSKKQQHHINPTATIRMDRVNITAERTPKIRFSEPLTEDNSSSSASSAQEEDEKEQKEKVRSAEQQQTPAAAPEESPKTFFVQTFVPFLLAGCGMVGAGILLDQASGWHFLSTVPEALILVPALLGLKGNLEMTLASRLSTMANLGRLDHPRQQLITLCSNIALIQTQAIVVALVASMLAIGTHWIDGNAFDIARSLCVVLSGTVSASITSLVLTSLMVFLVIMARRCGLNPDNIATPLAAATGDVASLAFLILSGTWFYRVRDQHLAALITLFVLVVSSVPVWAWLAFQMRETRAVLKHGWYAIMAAMLISTGAGYVLRHAIYRFTGLGLFQPVINGVGGNLVAVQASKLGTYLHQWGEKGILPANTLLTYVNPLRTFACKEAESNNALILLLMSVPGHLLFIGLLLLAGEIDGQALNFPFMAIYLCATTLQVAFLLYCCQLLCRCLWRLRWDPNVNTIPLLTALGDFVGITLLAGAFLLHAELFPEYGATGAAMPNPIIISSTDSPSPLADDDPLLVQVFEQQQLDMVGTTLGTDIGAAAAKLLLSNSTSSTLAFI